MLEEVLEWAEKNQSEKSRLKGKRMRPHFVYAFFYEGRAQYIGMSLNAENRIKQHMRESDWCRDEFETVFFECATRRAALDLEKKLIKIMMPKFNKMHKKETP